MNKNKPRKLADSGFRDWKPSQLPDLSNKTFVVTGGNSGIGFEAAKYLGQASAKVIIACRNLEKGQEALQALSETSNSEVEMIQLDLASLSSVRKAAEELRTRVEKIDGLINNAGIMQTPEQKTEDGFEMQIGTNHLGHFLWTGLLIDLVEAANGRVVVVSSVAHKFGKLNFEDLMSKKKYSASNAYCQSKLANLSFALELDRRLKEKGSDTQCIACHPGYSATNLQSTGPAGVFNIAYKVLNKFAQPQEMGAIPTVLAAAGTEAVRGGYYGPQGIMDSKGRVSDASVSPTATDELSAKRLWDESEKLVGLNWG